VTGLTTRTVYARCGCEVTNVHVTRFDDSVNEE
jgi:hypothetical protein